MTDNTPREQLAQLIFDTLSANSVRSPHPETCADVADAIAASDWLAAHDREVAAKALSDAGTDILSAHATNGLGGRSSRLIDPNGDCSVWLFGEAGRALRGEIND